MRGLAMTLGGVLLITGCGEQPSSESVNATTAPAAPVAPPEPMVRRLATTFEIDRYAASRPTTTTAPAPTTRAADPLSTPRGAVTEMFRLMKENKPAAVRQVLIDPPEPNILNAAVAQTHDELTHGGTWLYIEEKIDGSAAAVIYRTDFSTGVVDISPIILVRRYDRWKIILQDYNPLRFSVSERADLIRMLKWGQARTQELRQAEAAQPTTRQQP